jgi:hypothetical protein
MIAHRREHRTESGSMAPDRPVLCALKLTTAKAPGARISADISWSPARRPTTLCSIRPFDRYDDSQQSIAVSERTIFRRQVRASTT